MKNLQFWLSVDKLILESEIIIDKPKGSKHFKHGFVYPFDYGYLKTQPRPTAAALTYV